MQIFLLFFSGQEFFLSLFEAIIITFGKTHFNLDSMIHNHGVFPSAWIDLW